MKDQPDFQSCSDTHKKESLALTDPPLGADKLTN